MNNKNFNNFKILIITGARKSTGTCSDDAVLIHADSKVSSELVSERQKLECDLTKTQQSAYATGTAKNLISQWRSFYRFSKRFKFNEWPVPIHTLCLYAQYLEYSFKSVKSVKNYLYGIRTLHILMREQPPNFKDIEMKLTLRGLTKIMIAPVKRAQLMTPEILTEMLGYLNLNKQADRVFWAIMLIGFFGFLRKSNLVSDSILSFDPVKQLMRGHMVFKGDIAILNVTWTKTIQNREKLLEIPPFPIPGSPLCPVAVLKALLLKPGKKHHPLFGNGRRVLYTYNKLQNRMRVVLKKAGYRSKAFSLHSLRRGGSSFAHRAGVPESLIQVQGSWSSDACKRYLSFPLEMRALVSLKMREKILMSGF